MVGTSRGSSGRGARVYGAVQRVQRRALRRAVGAVGAARRRSESGASHCERGADVGERCAAAGRAGAGGGGAVVAVGGGPGVAASGGGARTGGVGGDERAGVARGASGVGGGGTPAVSTLVGPTLPPSEVFLGGLRPPSPRGGTGNTPHPPLRVGLSPKGRGGGRAMVRQAHHNPSTGVSDGGGEGAHKGRPYEPHAGRRGSCFRRNDDVSDRGGADDVGRRNDDVSEEV